MRSSLEGFHGNHILLSLAKLYSLLKKPATQHAAMELRFEQSSRSLLAIFNIYVCRQ